MKTLKLIATLAIALCASTVFAHGESSPSSHSSAAPEQMPWGIAGQAKAVRRTITLRMTDDMRFSPSQLRIKKGETVRLRVLNQGQLVHEIVLGTAQTLDEYAAMMVKFPGMEHDAPYMAHVAPGTKGELVWKFNQAGSFDFACLIAGHFQAGMRGTITVTP